MHDLRVPDLAAGADAGHLGLVPIDSVRFRVQKPFGIDGAGVAFVYQKPMAGLAIINAATRPQTFNAGAPLLTRGVATRIPVRSFDVPDAPGQVNG